MSGCLLALAPNVAQACGGYFTVTPPSNRTSPRVTGHQVAVAVSEGRNVLWDKIVYEGEPTSFVWVLPVRGDTELAIAEDAWFEALDAVTDVAISHPQLNCFSRTQSSNRGCSCGSTEESGDSFGGTGGAGFGNAVLIELQHVSSVGPYQVVKLTASDDGGLDRWLPDNGYVVPDATRPILAAFAKEGFDFLVLRFNPSTTAGLAMKPVRVVTTGGGPPVLPLRMAAAGAGANAPLDMTLYVIGEGRYQADGFDEVKVDLSKVTWDWSRGGSNYADIRAQTLAQNPRAWLTTFALPNAFTRAHVDAFNQKITFSAAGTSQNSPSTFANLADIYFAEAAVNGKKGDICQNVSFKLQSRSTVVDTCHTAADDGGLGAGPQEAGVVARTDGGPKAVCDRAAANQVAASDLSCSGYSDLSAALLGLHPSDVWITRLDASLSPQALALDLKLKLATSQEEVSNVHNAATHVNPPCDLLEDNPAATLHSRATEKSPRFPLERAGVGFVSILGLFMARRLRRHRP